MEKYDIPEPNSLDSQEGVPDSEELSINIDEIKKEFYNEGYENATNAFKHDYSKELNTADIRIDRYEKHIKQEKERLLEQIKTIESLITETSDDKLKEGFASVIARLTEIHGQYGLPMLDLQAITRYNLMHWKLDQAGSLYEEPAFVTEKLLEGTKKDIVSSVNLLVWYRSPELTDATYAQKLAGRDMHIFAYDLGYKLESKVIDDIMKHLRADLNVSIEDMDHYIPRPLLKCFSPQDVEHDKVVDVNDQALWPIKDEKIIRPHMFGFMPTIIEVLRTAYRSAYLNTLSKTLKVQRPDELVRRQVNAGSPYQDYIEIKPKPIFKENDSDSLKSYELDIRFPLPFADTENIKEGDEVKSNLFNQLEEGRRLMGKAVSGWSISSPKVYKIIDDEVIVSVVIKSQS
ncbi:hypothetical protein H7Y21_01500 [Arenimonas sp.]|nr:hypothetical protein [Candidatus Parcubacteria bacterium]